MAEAAAMASQGTRIFGEVPEARQEAFHLRAACVKSLHVVVVPCFALGEDANCSGEL